VDHRPDFDILNEFGYEISANSNTYVPKTVMPGQLIQTVLTIQVANADTKDHLRDSDSDSIEGPIWWKIEGVTGWKLLVSEEFDVDDLDKNDEPDEKEWFTIPNYPNETIVFQACVDGDDEVKEEDEGSRDKISSPGDDDTNNCSRLEKLYIGSIEEPVETPPEVLDVELWHTNLTYEQGGYTLEDYPRFLRDMNQDGRDDVVAIGYSGVRVYLSTGTNFVSDPNFSLNNFGVGQGWSGDYHLWFVQDMDGNGYPDIAGFGNYGLIVSLNNGVTLESPQMWYDNMAHFSGGWRVYRHPRQPVDINADGKMDFIGFGGSVMVIISDGFACQRDHGYNLAQFGYSQTWLIEKHIRQTGDANGDGLPDIIGFGSHSVYVSINNGSGFDWPESWFYGFAYNTGGWRIETHPRFVVDINNDGLDDIVGFSNAGLRVALSNGTQFNTAHNWAYSDYFGVNHGFASQEDYPRQLIDLNADGLPDIVGFTHYGVTYVLNTSNGFGERRYWISDSFGVTSGWDGSKHIRTFADVDGDGYPDVVGFGPNGVEVLLNDPTDPAHPAYYH
jgi:hypothetical protein